MTKKFYGVDSQGSIRVERLGSHPDPLEGRVYNYTVDGKLWASDGTSNDRIVQEDGDGYNINITGAADSARFAIAGFPFDKGFVFGGNDGNQMNEVEEYNSETGVWTSKTGAALMTVPRETHAASTILNKGYTYGGWYQVGGYRADTDEYTPDTWVNKQNMGTARNRLAASTILDKGYTYGGYTGGGYLTDCEAYTPSLDSWSVTTANMLVGKRWLAATTILDKGYIFGGFNGTFSNLCEQYTPGLNTWTTSIDSLNTGVAYNVAFTIYDKGYSTGGQGSLGFVEDVEEYDPGSNTWTVKTGKSPLPKRWAGGTKILSKGYVFFGSDPTNTQKCEEYDPTADTWTVITDGPSPARAYPAATSIAT